MLFCLLAVAALTAPLLPLCDAGLAVDCTLTHDAEDGYFSLWHDDFLANDAEGVGEEAEAVKFFAVAYAVFCHEVGSAKGVYRGLTKGQ